MLGRSAAGRHKALRWQNDKKTKQIFARIAAFLINQEILSAATYSLIES